MERRVREGGREGGEDRMTSGVEGVLVRRWISYRAHEKPHRGCHLEYTAPGKRTKSVGRCYCR